MTPRLLALIPLAVALNVAMSFLVNQLGLPVYLDTVGTVLAAVLVGPLAGATVGVLSQVLIGLQVGVFMLAFAPIQALIAALAAVAAWQGGFATPWRAVGWGVLVGAMAGAASSVISYFVFAGVTATGVTAVTTLLRSLGLTQPEAVVVSSIGTDLLDKTIVFLVIAFVLRAFPQRLLGRFPWAGRALGR